MNLNKKGFTFVELLVVVVLIGILSGLAIVSVTKVLEKSHIEYAKKQAALITAAAREYYLDNKKELPSVPLTTKKVLLDTLVQNAYIDDVVDYKEKNYDYYKSFTTVKKMGEGKYIYYTILIDQEGNVVANENPDNENKKSDSIIIDISYDTTKTFRKGPIDGIYYVNGQIDLNLYLSNTAGLSSYKYYIKRKQNNSSGTSKYKESKYIVIDNKSYNDTLSLSADNLSDGIYQIEIIAYDYNATTKQQISKRIVIDKTKPKCSLELVDNSYKKLTKTSEGWFNKKSASAGINIRPSVKEDNNVCLYKMNKLYSTGLGLYKMDTFPVYKNADIDDGNFDGCGYHSGPNDLVFNVLTNEEYSSPVNGDKYTFKVQDYAGNISTCSTTVKIDTQPPTCEISVTGGQTINHLLTNQKWYTTAPTIGLSYKDIGSGINLNTVKLNNNTKLTVTQTEDTTGTDYSGTVADYAENVATCGPITIRKDSQPPKVTKTVLNINGRCIHTTDKVKEYICSDTANEQDRRFYVDYTTGLTGVHHFERWNCDTNNKSNTTSDSSAVNQFVSESFTEPINERIKYVVYDNLGRSASSDCGTVHIDNTYYMYKVGASIAEPKYFENYSEDYQTGTMLRFYCSLQRKKSNEKDYATITEQTMDNTLSYESYDGTKTSKDFTGREKHAQLQEKRYKNIQLKCSYTDGAGNEYKDTVSGNTDWFCYYSGRLNHTNCVSPWNCQYCSTYCYNKWSNSSGWNSGVPNDDSRKTKGCDASFFSN